MIWFRFFAAIMLLLPAVAFPQALNNIFVLPAAEQLPAGAKKIGSIKVGNNATHTRCDYEQLVTQMKQKAQKMGGNIVKITELQEPVFIGKCYKVQADVYYARPLPQYSTPPTADTIAKDRNNTLLYIYRLKDTLALQGGFDIYLNGDSLLCHSRSRHGDMVKLEKEGTITLKAKKAKLTLNTRHGEAYYIRCGTRQGDLKPEPVMEIVDQATGEKEYQSLTRNKKDIDVRYLQQIH